MSFTTCIDLIANYTQDAHQQLVPAPTVQSQSAPMTTSDVNQSKEHLTSYLDSVSSCVQSLRDTNAFMLMTINRCIDYAKATKGVKLVPKLETIDLLETMQLPLSCMRNVQSRIAIVLNAVPENVCSHIITDKQWLQENLLCLLSNAVKYSSKGEVTVSVSWIDQPSTARSVPDERIPSERLHSNTPSLVSSDLASSDGISSNSNTPRTVRPFLTSSGVSFMSVSTTNLSASSNSNQPPPSWLLIEVEDTGIGVPHDAMNFLFQPFKQTQRLAGGTGLGLYSLAKRIEALSGEYGVRDRKDGQKGSVFWFTIPYRPDTVTAALMENNHKFTNAQFSIAKDSLGSISKHPLSPPLKRPESVVSLLIEEKPVSGAKPTGLNILLVDDALPIVKMTSLMLRKLGHQITPAENGEVAVKIVESQWAEHGKSFDVILMDLQMPVMDGLEATKRIRAMEGVLRYERLDNGSGSIMVEVKDGVEYAKLLPKHYIVGLSANSDPETESNAMDHGTDAFIAKPFTVDTFANLIYEKFDLF